VVAGWVWRRMSAMEAELTRTVRFCLSATGKLEADAPAENTFAAWPPMRGLGRFYELHVTCRGEVDQRTGYMVNIKQIDHAAREQALPVIAKAAREQGDDVRLGAVLGEVMGAMGGALEVEVRRVCLGLTPTLWCGMEVGDMGHALISQQYEFSAAHRLHVEDLSDAENRRVFGKCNNPSGHGHNYRLEVTVRSAVDHGRIAEVGKVDEIVNEVVVQRFDHKHLNRDTAEFAGVNPSVEHIAKVIYELLEPAMTKAGLEMEQVRVWETSKTVCTYRG
jgi:6-pyruvoyltetrahydropterin/6-carboxytetrahydropterin synthase